jgi:hypothetical protein
VAVITRMPGGKVYLDADDGCRYRVHDVCFGPPHCAPHKRRVFTPPAQKANYRHFVAADGKHRSYKFAKGDNRELDAARAHKQLYSAAYPATKPHDPDWLGDPR